MAALTIRLAATCSGGNHLTFAITGAKTQTVQVELADMTAPIDAEDAERFCKVVARLARSGRTPAQAKTLLTTGVTVTV